MQCQEILVISIELISVQISEIMGNAGQNGVGVCIEISLFHIARLAQMRGSLPLLAPRESLQAVMTECELPSRVLRWKQNASVARIRLANLEAMLALAAKYEDVCRSAQHAASISGLILWMNEQSSNEQD